MLQYHDFTKNVPRMLHVNCDRIQFGEDEVEDARGAMRSPAVITTAQRACVLHESGALTTIDLGCHKEQGSLLCCRQDL